MAATTAPIALITGASRGIGRLLAQKLGQRGVTVVVTYKGNADLAEESLADVKAAGGDGITAQVDIEQPESIDALFDLVRDTYGRLDYFVANAAASAFKPVADLKLHHLDRSYATNARSFVLGAQRAAQLMDRGGRIVVVTSYGSLRAFPTYAALGAAKAMSESYMKYMAVEFGPRQITVNAVNGGLIDTDSLEYFYTKVPGQAPIDTVFEKLPLQRPGTADDMADAVDFLLSDKAGYITGQVLSVDGGLTVIAPPFWADTTSPLRDAVLPPADAAADSAADTAADTAE
ncbi:short-chain dehydrogenase [Curtobacterium sp. BH-2-1-1]|uniref:SDR family oxidoreductase n=1 Tax=unclassified Curtobacterium TaxID=257496 RepID=UPI00089DDC4B|nr:MULTISPECIES: SDR family oxidoreductase [unclassified Curtobacterium]AOX64633.1 short-chain dehydrogenase [Curtobacterium sp. BH-2-1-1]SFF72278.1 enoyl-[acyl-carrier protein] reductase III [Curtobacterium sp. YR515]